MLAAFDDLSGDVSAEYMRQRHTGQTLANPQIDMVQCAGFDADKNLVLTRLGVGDVLVTQNFGTTEFVDTDGFHRSSETNSNYHRRIRSPISAHRRGS